MGYSISAKADGIDLETMNEVIDGITTVANATGYGMPIAEELKFLVTYTIFSTKLQKNATGSLQRTLFVYLTNSLQNGFKHQAAIPKREITPTKLQENVEEIPIIL